MRFLLIQLSDIHIVREEDVVTERSSQIVDAVKNLDHSLDLCVIVVTGDVAFSGTDDQYLIAFGFLAEIRELLIHSLSGPNSQDPVPVHIVVAPGNHDCDFSLAGPMREVILSSVLEDPSRAGDEEFVQACTKVQDPFFDFLDAVETQERVPLSEEYDARLCYKYDFIVEEGSVSFVCINTAWLSQRRETQGNLFFPSQAMTTGDGDVDLVVAAFHHPYNWIESNSARPFREGVESTADLILTGHEHTSSWSVQQGHRGNRNTCVEGGVLQDNSNPRLSEFNVFVFDTERLRRKYGHLQWDTDRYTWGDGTQFGDEGSGLKWSDYETNDLRSSDRFTLSDNMSTFVADPGIHLTHRQRGQLTLQDIFLYPDLFEITKRRERFGQRFSGESVHELLESQSRLIITGDIESGKTCLAKTLFLHLLEKGITPVFVDARRKPPTDDRVQGFIEDRFTEQYRPGLLDSYRQLDKSLRAIIIDDYDKIPLSPIRKSQFLQAVASTADYLVVLSNDMASDLDELTNPGHILENEDGVGHYRIQPLGYVLRSKLVERWMLLGEPIDTRDITFVRQLAETNETLNTLVGKNYIPCYPVYVLSVLQALDSATHLDITASTHGYFYELFIKTSLARGRNPQDFDVVASYLSFLAYRTYAEKLSSFSDSQFSALHKEYETIYDIERSYGPTREQLLGQHILVLVEDGFRFKYKYLYNYFVASYIKDHISEASVRTLLGNIVRSLHVESNANILLFLAHLSRDPFVISELLEASRELYPDYLPAELDDDISFLKDLNKALPEVVYEENDTGVNRQIMLNQMDQDDPSDVEASGIIVEEWEREFDENDPTVRFVSALRHLEIMGQVVKNFPGSLEGSAKLSITRECFHLGLRSLSVVMEMIRVGQSDILKQMSEEIREQHPRFTTNEIDIRAKETLTGIAHMLSYGMVRIVAKAVGSRDLTNTYARLQEESHTLAFKLINSALEVDYGKPFPVKSIQGLASEFEEAPLPLSVLQRLVVTHFNLYPEKFKVKQMVCSSLGIKSSILGSNPAARMIVGRKKP